MADFYETLAPYYHLIFPDWEESMRRQGRALDAIVRARAGAPVRTVLDAACGIGTQSLALARLGYAVTASDASPVAVARAAREAEARGLTLTTTVADMREAFDVHRRTFDLVLACDNAIPHLLSDAEILRAFEQLHRCTAPGGLCLVSVRDYAALEQGGTQIHPYGVRQVGTTRYVLFQVWDWEGDRYDTTFYVIEHPAAGVPSVRSMRSTCYAVPIPTLMETMRRAGFAAVERLDGEYFQPVLVGRRPAPSGS
jgi:SAM-dependent methyltransferase